MELDLAQAYSLLLARRDRAGMKLEAETEAYYKSALEGAQQELVASGIQLDGTLADTMLLVDLANWNLSNRDQAGQMPAWLRLKRRERWLREGRDGA